MKKWLVILSRNDRLAIDAEAWEFHNGQLRFLVDGKPKAWFQWDRILGFLEAEHVRADLK